jgi:phosphohistidine phosphatase SixA
MNIRRATERAELASGQPARKTFEFLRTLKAKAVVLVGHEPNLSILVAAAVGGKRARLKIKFRKGGAACLEFPGSVRPGQATLKWLVPPRALRRLK